MRHGQAIVLRPGLDHKPVAFRQDRGDRGQLAIEAVLFCQEDDPPVRENRQAVEGVRDIVIDRLTGPAAGPAILTGMRISMGIAWLVIVAAEMLVGGTGIGYFVWNQWNNLSLGNVVFAVLMIGIVGMLLDMGFGLLQKKVSYRE